MGDTLGMSNFKTLSFIFVPELLNKSANIFVLRSNITEQNLISPFFFYPHSISIVSNLGKKRTQGPQGPLK
jgi:hypothetical protein